MTTLSARMLIGLSDKNLSMPFNRQRFSTASPDLLPSEQQLSCFRKPQRITITVSWGLYQKLLGCSDQQGRSLSNLACHWLELQSEAMRRH